MTFKEFTDWANDRTCDGQWGMALAIDCAEVCETVYKEPFWRRKRVWETFCGDMNLNLLKRIADTDSIRESINHKNKV